MGARSDAGKRWRKNDTSRLKQNFCLFLLLSGCGRLFNDKSGRGLVETDILDGSSIPTYSGVIVSVFSSRSTLDHLMIVVFHHATRDQRAQLDFFFVREQRTFDGNLRVLFALKNSHGFATR